MEHPYMLEQPFVLSGIPSAPKELTCQLLSLGQTLHRRIVVHTDIALHPEAVLLRQISCDSMKTCKKKHGGGSVWLVLVLLSS
jgi:hypothetical protein